MGNAIEETEKRLKISKNISSQLEGIVRGVLLGGSMGYGQNYSVNEKSDIDMVVVCDKGKINNLAETDYFKGQIPKKVLDIFDKRIINFFWVVKNINDIEVNTYIYDTKGFINFCLLKEKIVGYIPTKPKETQTQHRFDGSEIMFNRNVRSYDQGFIYEKPALADGKFWGGVPREDFLIGRNYILYEENKFFTLLEEKIGNAIIKQMMKEFPNPDLGKINILNTIFYYATKSKKLPKEILEQVKRKTKYFLDNFSAK